MNFRSAIDPVVPGLAIAAVVGIAATFLSLHYKASAMLFALLLGMALNFLAEEGKCLPGIQFASSVVLRTGVARLGLRVRTGKVTALGWATVALVVASEALTILAGIVLARFMKLGSALGTLTGGAVAICGASAALAIASILPRHANAERDASFTVIGVTALSTLAMILYPILVASLGLDHRAAGVFLGGTIHDVAQVVGAGYSLSQETGDTATIVKLLRVAMLLPACLAIGLALHVRGASAAHAAPVLPWFGVVFAAFVVVTSLGWIPGAGIDAGSVVSRGCVATPTAAIGMKPSLNWLVARAMKPGMLIVIEPHFLASRVLAVLAWK